MIFSFSSVIARVIVSKYVNRQYHVIFYFLVVSMLKGVSVLFLNPLGIFTLLLSLSSIFVVGLSQVPFTLYRLSMLRKWRLDGQSKAIPWDHFTPVSYRLKISFPPKSRLLCCQATFKTRFYSQKKYVLFDFYYKYSANICFTPFF